MKYFLFFLFVFSYQSAWALSCLRPEPLPPLAVGIENHKTVGVFEVTNIIQDIEKQNFERQKETRIFGTEAYKAASLYEIKVKQMVKGEALNDVLTLKLTGWAWPGRREQFQVGQELTLFSMNAVENGVLMIKQDIGCNRNDWSKYPNNEALAAYFLAEEPVKVSALEAFFSFVRSWFK